MTLSTRTTFEALTGLNKRFLRTKLPVGHPDHLDVAVLTDADIAAINEAATYYMNAKESIDRLQDALRKYQNAEDYKVEFQVSSELKSLLDLNPERFAIRLNLSPLLVAERGAAARSALVATETDGTDGLHSDGSALVDLSGV